jgi:hypothetical protein
MIPMYSNTRERERERGTTKDTIAQLSRPSMYKKMP